MDSRTSTGGGRHSISWRHGSPNIEGNRYPGEAQQNLLAGGQRVAIRTFVNRRQLCCSFNHPLSRATDCLAQRKFAREWHDVR